MSSRKAKKGHNKLVRRPRESKHGSKRVSTFNHNKRRSMYAWGPRILFAGRSKRRAQEEADPNGGQEEEEDANSDGSQEEALADYDEDSSSNDPLVQQEDKVVPPGSPGSVMPPPTPFGTKRAIRATRIQDQVASPKRLRLAAPAPPHPKAYIST